MSQAIHEPVVSRAGVLAAAALILFALASVTTARLTGMGEVRMTLPAAEESRSPAVPRPLASCRAVPGKAAR